MQSKGAVHILGEICPRSDPDIAHMKYYLDPIKLIYKTLLDTHLQVCKYGPCAPLAQDQNPWTMQKIENLDYWPERHLYDYQILDWII